MTTEAAAWLLAALLGGVLALDGTSVGQFMLSRPLVACTLAGALAGSPAAGAALGVVLEALQLAVLPVGATRYPEAAPAAVAAATVFVHSGAGPETLAALVLFALAWEQVGAWTITRLRTWTATWLARPGGMGTAAALQRSHLAAVLLDGVRGTLVTASGLAGAAAVAAFVGAARPDPAISEAGTALAAAAAAAASVQLFGTRRLPWFAAGAGVALAALWAGG